ncbi:DNA polymerase III subunit epsilon [Pseudochrobactrum sp. Wa41.01b-1]|uniref:DNA polymerase III subunit epsilon n=1 Tax=unclassified Pseudochrobactrum TaxID=2647013 RepID=UPI0003A2B7B9|nr:MULTISPECIES: DNA polymerase III subunit epsilon [unclassified Pseudochrobactrum]QYM71874.1 DNA polymerase III subunit epsilon [Pseudochrobactrum sp. Wa41.01b-1]UCA45588.1 DNA polymerase III subunit epsilon [Pseudochrobactrum sp. XF203]
MREIVFDTETTGLEKNEDRVIEIGCIEMVNKFITGKTFHIYINPQGKKVHPDALAVHGITDESLLDKPTFPEIADEFLTFIEGAKLVAHNAMFDIGFLNAELERIDRTPISTDVVIDTLALARRKHPMGPNTLDALCKRYGVDNAHRKLHGALLDTELLAEVYIELLGGRQTSLGLSVQSANEDKNGNEPVAEIVLKARPQPLPSRLTADDLAAHQKLIDKMGDKAIWKKYLN